MQDTYQAIKVALEIWKDGDRQERYEAAISLLDRERSMKAATSDPEQEGCLLMLDMAIEIMLGKDRVSGFIESKATPGQYAGMAPQ
jgi:hypothetical protein